MNENDLKKEFQKHDADKEQIRANVIRMAQSENTDEKRRFILKPVFAVSLCLILAVSGLSGYIITAEAKEYKEAVSFFDEYNLSTDGLTRTEIKAVYKDIEMKTYSYEKTKEIINSCYIQMNSTNLGQSDKSIKEIWDEYCNSIDNEMTSNKEHQGIWYDIEEISLISQENEYDITDSDSESTDDEKVGHFSQAVIIKYIDGSEQWRFTAPYDMYVEINDNVIISDDGIIIYGSRENTGSAKGYACIFKIDNSGELLWEYSDSAEGSDFEAAAVSENEIALFGHQYRYYGHKYHNSDIFTVIDKNGEVLRTRSTDCVEPGASYDIAVKVGDNYLVKQNSFNEETGRNTELISISYDGQLNDKITYSDNENDYQIEDIIYHNGKVYLSAQIANINEIDFYDRYSEITDEYYKKIFDQDLSDDSGTIVLSDKDSQKVKDLCAEQYDAVLFICDENSVITRAHCVKNARAGILGSDEQGRLTWQTLRIDVVKPVSIYTSSHYLNMVATKFSLTFDDSGKMVEKNEIGEEQLSK